jgi:hypothetical protein
MDVRQHEERSKDGVGASSGERVRQNAGRRTADARRRTVHQRKRCNNDEKRRVYQPCRYGSGRKFRFCHGTKAPRSPFSRLSPAMNAPHKGDPAFINSNATTL